MNKLKVLFALLLLTCAAGVSAQDVLIQKDGSTILAKVLEVNPSDVKYKKFNNLDGPTYTILKSELISINFENGEREVMRSTTTAPSSAPITTVSVPPTTTTATQQTSYATTYTAQPAMNQIDYATRMNAERLNTSGRRLRIWGTILMVVGGLNFVEGIYLGAYWEEPAFYWSNAGPGMLMFIGGAFMRNCGTDKKEMARKLLTADIAPYEFNMGNMTLAPSVNLMCDKTTFDKAVGAGVKITF